MHPLRFIISATNSLRTARGFAMMPQARIAIRAAAILAAALFLSGCVVVPAGGYYHPHRYYWGY
jgi:hypothetical protein